MQETARWERVCLAVLADGYFQHVMFKNLSPISALGRWNGTVGSGCLACTAKRPNAMNLWRRSRFRSAASPQRIGGPERGTVIFEKSTRCDLPPWG